MTPAREAELAGAMPEVPKVRDYVDWSVRILFLFQLGY